VSPVYITLPIEEAFLTGTKYKYQLLIRIAFTLQVKRLEKDVLKAMDEDAELITAVAASARVIGGDSKSAVVAAAEVSVSSTATTDGMKQEDQQHEPTPPPPPPPPALLNNKPLLRLSRGSSLDSQPPRSPFQSNPLLTAHDYAKSPLMEGCPDIGGVTTFSGGYLGGESDDEGDCHGVIQAWTKELVKTQIPICSVANPDPGSGVFLTPGSGIRNRFFRISDPGSQTHIF
jgi:hypothetical protein